MLMAVGARLVAAFAITDPLKPEAPAVIAALRWVWEVWPELALVRMGTACR